MNRKLWALIFSILLAIVAPNITLADAIEVYRIDNPDCAIGRELTFPEVRKLKGPTTIDRVSKIKSLLRNSLKKTPTRTQFTLIFPHFEDGTERFQMREMWRINNRTGLILLKRQYFYNTHVEGIGFVPGCSVSYIG